MASSKVRSSASSARTEPSSTPRTPDVARARRGTGAGRPPAPAPARFNPFRSRWFIAGAAVVVVGIVLFVVLFTGKDEPAVDPLAQEIAKMQQEEAARNIANVPVLGEQIIATQDELLPVMSGLHGPLPTDGTLAVPATAAQVAEWKTAIATAHEDIAGLPSGSSEYNIARNGFDLAVKVLGSSVAAYESALTATGAQVDPLLALAGDLRVQASDAWSVAAIELDLLYNDANKGHLHISLPILPTGDDGPDTESGH